MISTSKNILFSLFVLSLLVKLSYFIYTDGFERQPIEDARSYHNHAVSIYEGRGFSGAADSKRDISEEKILSSRPPALPYLIAGVYSITEVNPSIARLFNIFISTVSLILVFLIAEILFNNRKVSILAALLFAFYPPSIHLSSLLLTETLASFFVLLSCLFLLLGTKANSKKYFFLGGLTLALLTLTRSQFILLPFFIIFLGTVLNYLGLKNQNFSIKNVSILVLAYFIAMAPWALRNYQIHDTFMPTTSRLGYMLYLCNNDLDNEQITKGGYYRDQFIVSGGFSSLRESEQSSQYLELVKQEVMSNPEKLLKPVFFRFINTISFRPNPYVLEFRLSDWIMMFIWLPIIILFFLSIKRSTASGYWIMYSFIFYALLIVLPFWGTPRFRFPVDGLILVCSLVYIYPYLRKLLNARV